jgi:hypothetical protein
MVRHATHKTIKIMHAAGNIDQQRQISNENANSYVTACHVPRISVLEPSNHCSDSLL